MIQSQIKCLLIVINFSEQRDFMSNQSKLETRIMCFVVRAQLSKRVYCLNHLFHKNSLTSNSDLID